MAEKNGNTGFQSMPRMRRRGSARFAPAEKPKNLKGTLLRLWEFFGSEKKILISVTVLIILDALIVLAGPYLTGRAIDAMSGGNSRVAFTRLGLVLAALASVFVSDAVFTFIENFIVAGASQRISKSMRQTLFSRLQHLPIAFFDRHPHGDIMSRFTNDMDNISSTISQSLVSVISDVISVAGSFILMMCLSPVLTCASLITVPLMLLLTRSISKKTRVLFREQQAALGALNGLMEESIAGVQVVKAFNREQKVTADFDEYNGRLLKVGQKAQIWTGYMMPMMNVIGNLGFAVVAGLGGVLAVRGLITIGVIASFLNYSKQFTRPLNDIANIYNTLLTAVAGAERVFEVMDETAEPGDRTEAVELRKPLGRVEFKDVCFAYRGGRQVLKNISFCVPAGGTVALVGATGAGKTTIVSLLNRFYDVTSGSILLDGADLRSYTRSSLRSAFGIVLQDTYLFSGTIKENIRYGRPGATDSEVAAAARTANADGFIRVMPDGYDTILSGSGTGLSQGQRQLIAIARAILADPPVMILDEATSNIDTRTEMRIQEAMAKLMHGRTCFIIAHRLGTIRGADQIMVVDGGRIVESGCHRELIEKGGRYAGLYRSQINA